MYLVSVNPRLPGPLFAMISASPPGGSVLWSVRAEADEVRHRRVAGGGLQIRGQADAGPEVELSRRVGAAAELPGRLRRRPAPGGAGRLPRFEYAIRTLLMLDPQSTLRFRRGVRQLGEPDEVRS